MLNKSKKYYVPASSNWPLVGSFALFCLLDGLATWVHGDWFAYFLLLFGFIILLYMIHGWLGDVIRENRLGLSRDDQVERSFRLGVYWFMFSEAMFFGAMFGALFFIRVFTLPILGGAENITHIVLWPSFNAAWPLLQNPDPSAYIGSQVVISPWGIPLLSSCVILLSVITISLAYWAILKEFRRMSMVLQVVTILLGLFFLLLQANEYVSVNTVQGMTLASGIYATTYYVLTGFYAVHMTVGITILTVMLYRMKKHDFNKQNNFAFKAATWFWYFISILWLLVFVFVYWL